MVQITTVKEDLSDPPSSLTRQATRSQLAVFSVPIGVKVDLSRLSDPLESTTDLLPRRQGVDWQFEAYDSIHAMFDIVKQYRSNQGPSSLKAIRCNSKFQQV